MEKKERVVVRAWEKKKGHQCRHHKQKLKKTSHPEHPWDKESLEFLVIFVGREVQPTAQNDGSRQRRRKRGR